MTTVTSQIVSQLQRSIARAIYGKEEAIQLALITLLARGHLLIEDVPGVGKTTLAQALAKSFHCSFQRIQFTSDLLPSDVLGVSVYNPETREFEFRSGPIFANVVLADEINRTTPRTQSALLEAMNEAQVTVDGKTLPLPQPFLVIATQNPVEHHGTYPLPESQLDRFLMRIRMGYPSHETEREILRKRIRDDSVAALEPVADVRRRSRDAGIRRPRESGFQPARLRAGNRQSHAQHRATRSGRQPARHVDAAARRASPRFSRWPRLLPARRLQAARGRRFFASRGGQLAPRFAAEKIGDDRSRPARDRRLRSRSSVSLASTAAQLWAKADRSGVRAFFLSIAALAVALLLALYSGAAAELGHLALAIASALGALLVAAWVAVTLVPVLAKRTPLRWIGYKMEYRVTREGWIYIGESLWWRSPR